MILISTAIGKPCAWIESDSEQQFVLFNPILAGQRHAHLFNDLAVPCQVGASAGEGLHGGGELIKGGHVRQSATTAVSAVAVEREARPCS